jgi:hypothetical protein
VWGTLEWVSPQAWSQLRCLRFGKWMTNSWTRFHFVATFSTNTSVYIVYPLVLGIYIKYILFRK